MQPISERPVARVERRDVHGLVANVAHVAGEGDLVQGFEFGERRRDEGRRGLVVGSRCAAPAFDSAFGNGAS